VVVLGLTLTAAACGGDDSVATTTTTATTGVPPVVAGEAFPAERCEANRAAGTITYLTGFDYAAAASIVEILVADSKGYFDELCLDVELRSSFSTANYPLIAANSAQFASGGSYSEVVDFASKNDADFVVMSVAGKVPIDVLIVKPGVAETLEDLAGTTIGVKGKITPSVAAMLGSVGLTEGEDYETLLLDGFDPRAHIAVEQIVGFPGWKSNEPGQLERAGVEFDVFDPADYGVPGSFGVIFTNATFLAAHPSAAEDFMRAAMRGLADAIADPEAAAAIAIEYINGGGNPNFLSPEGETYRWTVDAGLVADSTPDGQGVAVPNPSLMQTEVEAFAGFGLFNGVVPDIAGTYDDSWAAAVYAPDLTVIWPAG
jgi:NitT/TauT family transport system substrate-binding protein